MGLENKRVTFETPQEKDTGERNYMSGLTEFQEVHKMLLSDVLAYRDVLYASKVLALKEHRNKKDKSPENSIYKFSHKRDIPRPNPVVVYTFADETQDIADRMRSIRIRAGRWFDTRRVDGANAQHVLGNLGQTVAALKDLMGRVDGPQVAELLKKQPEFFLSNYLTLACVATGSDGRLRYPEKDLLRYINNCDNLSTEEIRLLHAKYKQSKGENGIDNITADTYVSMQRTAHEALKLWQPETVQEPLHVVQFDGRKTNITSVPGGYNVGVDLDTENKEAFLTFQSGGAAAARVPLLNHLRVFAGYKELSRIAVGETPHADEINTVIIMGPKYLVTTTYYDLLSENTIGVTRQPA